MTRSPEPWRWSLGCWENPESLVDRDGREVLSCREEPSSPPSPEDAQRIVACVNALAGIPDPEKWVARAKDILQQADWESI